MTMPLNCSAKTSMKMDVCSPLDIRGVRQRQNARDDGRNHVNLMTMPLNCSAKTLMKMDVCSPLDIRGVRQRQNARDDGWNHANLIRLKVVTQLKLLRLWMVSGRIWSV